MCRVERRAEVAQGEHKGLTILLGLLYHAFGNPVFDRPARGEELGLAI